MPRDIYTAAETLGAAIERFDRQVAKAAAKPAVRRRIGPPPPRLPSTHAHRPTRHPVIQPRRYHRKPARTALDTVRTQEEHRRGGPTPAAGAVRRAAGRIADAVRGSLGKVRRGLRRLGGRPVRPR